MMVRKFWLTWNQGVASLEASQEDATWLATISTPLMVEQYGHEMADRYVGLTMTQRVRDLMIMDVQRFLLDWCRDRGVDDQLIVRPGPMPRHDGETT